MTPHVEPVFRHEGRAYVAHVAREIDDGVRDVIVYEVRGGGFRFVGGGVVGREFRVVRTAGVMLPRALAKAVDRALRGVGGEPEGAPVAPGPSDAGPATTRAEWGRGE